MVELSLERLKNKDAIVSIAALVLTIGVTPEATADTSDDLDAACSAYYKGKTEGPAVCKCLVDRSQDDQELQNQLVEVFNHPGSASEAVVSLMETCVRIASS